MRYLKTFAIYVIAVIGSGAIASANPTELITNGGFETNGGAGSSSFLDWSVVNQASGSGSWYAQTGTGTALNSFPVAPPPQGNFAAMTDQNGPGSHVLLQTFTVPGPGTVTLTFDYFRDNQAASGYSTPNTLDYTTIPNQQARVDILTAGASAFATDATDLSTVFQTNTGDPTMDSSYQTFSGDISSVVGSGGTYQLRFAEVDNQLFFAFGVDAVSIDFTPSAATPEPSYLAFLMIAGVALAIADVARRKRLRRSLT